MYYTNLCTACLPLDQLKAVRSRTLLAVDHGNRAQKCLYLQLIFKHSTEAAAYLWEIMDL